MIPWLRYGCIFLIYNRKMCKLLYIIPADRVTKLLFETITVIGTWNN